MSSGVRIPEGGQAPDMGQASRAAQYSGQAVWPEPELAARCASVLVSWRSVLGWS